MSDKIFLEFFPTGEELAQAAKKYLERHGPRVGMLSPEVPLISNLDNWLNVALIKQYHENMPKEASFRLVISELQRFDLEGIAHQRPAALGPREIFLLKLLRACMVREVHLLVDRPSLLLPAEKDASFLMKNLKMTEHLYRECRVMDFSGLKDRYLTDYGQEH